MFWQLLKTGYKLIVLSPRPPVPYSAAPSTHKHNTHLGPGGCCQTNFANENFYQENGPGAKFHSNKQIPHTMV